jgi:hypothetical protein
VWGEIADEIPPGSSCSIVATPTAKRLDVAVAALSRDLASEIESRALRPDHIQAIASMVPQQKVQFFGKVSGLIRAEVAHLTLWDTIEIDGTPHCFSELFSLRPRRPYYVNTDLCREGDSGAWVVEDSEELLSWYGMLVAGDGSEAYACFSEYIVDACRTARLELML